MDAIELKALRTLGERDEWPVNELPDWIDVDLLRCLDVEGVIEARYVTAHNHAKFPGDAPNLTYSRSSWFSPIQNPGMAGPWEKWLRPQGYDCWNLPREVRVSDRGRAELAKARRLQPLEAPAGPEWDAAMAAASSFRQTRAKVFPGTLMAIRGASFALHPVQDAEFGSDGKQVIGCAIWGASANFEIGMALVESDTGPAYAPIVSGDRGRPTTGVPLIDAWITRADVLRKLMEGSAGSFGPLPLTRTQVLAAAHEIHALVRDGAMSLLKTAPESIRGRLDALVVVADAAEPTVEHLDAAIRSLIAVSKEWPIESVAPLNDTNRAALDELLRLPPGQGVTGKQLIERLAGRTPKVMIEEVTLRKHVIPAIKPFGVLNKRGVGYYVDPSRRPAA